MYEELCVNIFEDLEEYLQQRLAPSERKESGKNRPVSDGYRSRM